MVDIPGLLEKSSQKTGFRREFFNIDNIPTNASNIVVAPFFGDLRSFFVLSSLLLHRYREQEKSSKYFIMCGWPGLGCLFPYVDEYWSIDSDVYVKKMYASTNSFENNNVLTGQFYRNLNQYFFEDVIPLDVQLANYYKNGLTNNFWLKYKKISRFLPGIPSISVLSKDFNREFVEKGGYKVFIYPVTHITNWHNQQCRQVPVGKDFWVALVNRLLKERFVPVICKNIFTHDLSEFNKDCICFSEIDMSKILTVMKMAGCVLDVFSGISRMALAARTPFIYVDERCKYVGIKEYEIDDLCGYNIPRKYIFSFSTILMDSSWEVDIFNLIIKSLNELLPIDREKLPSTSESFEDISYDIVRTKKLNRIGARLVKINKE